MNVVSHVPPLRRIQIGSDTPRIKSPVPAPPDISKEEADRIWSHVVAVARGTNEVISE